MKENDGVLKFDFNFWTLKCVQFVFIYAVVVNLFIFTIFITELFN